MKERKCVEIIFMFTETIFYVFIVTPVVICIAPAEVSIKGFNGTFAPVSN